MNAGDSRSCKSPAAFMPQTQVTRGPRHAESDLIWRLPAPRNYGDSTMDNHAPIILVIDGYSTGRELVRELTAHGARCVHLRSIRTLPAIFEHGFDVTPYLADMGYLGQPEQAGQAVRGMPVTHVVAGCEMGVTYAEQLASLLGLPTNDMSISAARRDKHAMIETLRSAGVPVAAQCLTDCVDAAQRWATAHGCWPVVVKPMSSAASDGVSICHSHEEIARAFDTTLNRANIFGEINHELLLQEYLDGEQYIVNTVSRDGRHYVTDAWHVRFVGRAGFGMAFDSVDLLDPSAPLAQALIDYTFEAITALGIQNGAAHSELRWTANGPRLIETGARVMGAAMDGPSYRAAEARTQASAYAEILLGDKAGRDMLFAQRHYARKRRLSKVFFTFEGAGTITATHDLANLATLATFHAHYRAAQPGARVWKSEDALCCGGVVYLVGHAGDEACAQVDADLARLREMEAGGTLYSVVYVDDAEMAAKAAKAAKMDPAAADQVGQAA